MFKPVLLTSVYSVDYIQAHTPELSEVLRDRFLTIMRNDDYDGRENGSVTYKPYRFCEFRNGVLTLMDSNGTYTNSSYSKTYLLDVTEGELNRLIDAKVAEIAEISKEIDKYKDWISYMGENKMKTFNVNTQNEVIQLGVLQQVKENAAQLTTSDLKELVSKLNSHV